MSLSEVNKKLDLYQQGRMKEIDAQIYQIVEQAAKNSVAKVVNVADHQELVMSALEQAKKDKFFA